MKKWLIHQFALSKGEFNGLLVLVLIIVFLKLLPRLHAFWNTEDTENHAKEKALYTLHLNEMKQSGSTATREFVELKKETRIATRRFYFDPNTLSLQGWQQLGLSQRQALSLLKYIAKGGQFRKAQDLQKMYTISDELYQQIAPYVRIMPMAEQKGLGLGAYKPGRKISRSELKLVSLNTADSAALVEVSGIGPAFARRILKYRERLGGFYRKEQLLEVYGLDSIKYEEISSQLIITPDQLRKININTAALEDFKNHPYIRYKQINALIQYRKQHGNYSNIADLNKIAILDGETIERLAPYLNFE